jgi:hypothetical protein
VTGAPAQPVVDGRTAHPHLVRADAPAASPPASWAELREAALGLADALAALHAEDAVHGACDAEHLRSGPAGLAWAPGPGVGTRAGDLQGLGAVLWAAVTGDRPGIGRVPRFDVPGELVDVVGSMLHPEPLGRYATAADVRTALAVLGPPDGRGPWFLPDATVAGAPRPPAPPLPAAPPPGVPEALWDSLRAVREEGRPRGVRIVGDDVLPTLLAFVRAVERAGAAAVRWVGVGAHAAEEDPALGDEAALQLARATGGTLEAAQAELAAWRAWQGSARTAADPGLRAFLREVRGEGWRGASVVVVTGVAGAPSDRARRLVEAIDPPGVGAEESFPLLWVVDGDVSRPAAKVEGTHPPPPPATPADRRLSDTRHLAGLAGPVLRRSVVERWAGPDLDAFLADPGVQAWGGRVWVTATRASAWAAEARERPDLRYLHRRVARALREHAPVRAAGHAALAGDDDLAETLALRAPGPRPAVPGPPGSASTVPSPEALAAASLLARLPSRTSALARRALRAEHLAFERAWAGDAAKAAEWLAESRATEGAGEAGLRRALGLSGLRMLAGDDAGADAAFEDALALADGEEVVAAWTHRASWLAWMRRWEPARAALARARSADRLRPGAEGEALLVEAALERGAGANAAARAAAEAAGTRFVEARSALGALRAELVVRAVERAAGTGPTPEALADLRARAAAAGATDLVAEADVLAADRARDLDDAAAARTAGERALRWATAVGHPDLRAASALAVARASLAAGRLPEATESARRAVEGLSGCPRHPIWASYRLLVSVLLAERGDHTQTWQWLWSAQEAGLPELVDRDTAAALERLVALAEGRSWGNVLRLAGKQGADLRARLGDPAAAAALTARVAAVVKGR